jgi:four helix bundle protein
VEGRSALRVESFRELIVWQRGIEVTAAVYRLTEAMPKSEMFGLTSQIRRAAVSIPSNIAEGQSRGSKSEFRHFLNIARGSNAEVQTQLVLIRVLNFRDDDSIAVCEKLSIEIAKMLNGLIATLK